MPKPNQNALADLPLIPQRRLSQRARENSVPFSLTLFMREDTSCSYSVSRWKTEQEQEQEYEHEWK
jgi:hypothetical protein